MQTLERGFLLMKIQRNILRINKDKENPYVMVNKGVVRDEQLSWKARGLMCYLLSLPDDWTIYLDELEKHSAKDGRDSLASGIKELIKYGYIVREAIRTEKGTFSSWTYTVYESPQSIESTPIPPNIEPVKPIESTINGKPDNGLSTNGFSNSGLSNSGKPATTNTYSTNTDLTKKINNKKKNSEVKTLTKKEKIDKYEKFYL